MYSIPRFCAGVALIICAGGSAIAAGADCAAPAAPTPNCVVPGAPGMPGAPVAPGMPGAQAPATDAFAQAPPAGGEGAVSAVPNMIGDLFGGRRAYTPIFGNIAGADGVIRPTFVPRAAPVPQGIIPGVTAFTVDLFINGVRVPAGSTLTGAQVAALQSNARLPAGGSAIQPLLKITENESPAPQDRVYTSYNYYNDVERKLNPAPSREVVHREIVGFEKTLLDGNASVGARLPFFELFGDDVGNQGLVGDLSIILKYALLNDRDSGNVASVGLVVTAPTGADFTPSGFGAPTIHSTLLQPYVSAIYHMSRDFYVQGFSSVVVPTDGRDVTLLANDVAAGYFVYRDRSGERLLTAVVPTLEVHVNTPLNHRGALTEPIGVSDLVDLTLGTSFGIGSKSFLTIGATAPVTGPRPFDIEAQVLFNCRF